METILVPGEKEFKTWIREVIQEYFEQKEAKIHPDPTSGEPLLPRKEIAAFLDVSLVTLHDWMKRGLPSHKQRGRVYFLKSEVLAYIKTKDLSK